MTGGRPLAALLGVDSALPYLSKPYRLVHYVEGKYAVTRIHPELQRLRVEVNRCGGFAGLRPGPTLRLVEAVAVTLAVDLRVPRLEFDHLALDHRRKVLNGDEIKLPVRHAKVRRAGYSR